MEDNKNNYIIISLFIQIAYIFDPEWENSDKNIFLELQWLIDKSIIQAINSSANLTEYDIELVVSVPYCLYIKLIEYDFIWKFTVFIYC